MKKKKKVSYIGAVALLFFGVMISSTFAGSADKQGYSPEMKAKIEEMKKELKKFTDERATVERGTLVQTQLGVDNGVGEV